jgi:hypothetical protein
MSVAWKVSKILVWPLKQVQISVHICPAFYSGHFESLRKISHFVTHLSLSNTLLLASKCIQYCIVLYLPFQVKFLGCTCSVPPPAATNICVDAMHCCLLNRCIPL